MSLFVPRDEERSCLRNPRPRRHLHDGDDGAGAGAGAHLAQSVAQAGVDLVGGRPDQLELLPHRLRELDRLEPQLEDGRRELEQLRAERST